MGVPSTLPEQMAYLFREVSELNRRLQNKERTGKVVEADHENGLYRVEILPGEATADGKPYLTPWIPFRETGAGENRTHMPLSIGEQVAFVSQSGDIVDAEIVQSLPSDDNPRPSNKGDEYILSQVGKTKIHVTDGGDAVIIQVGASSIKLTDGEIILTTPKFTGVQS